jgi:hypothetical protein
MAALESMVVPGCKSEGKSTQSDATVQQPGKCCCPQTLQVAFLFKCSLCAQLKLEFPLAHNELQVTLAKDRICLWNIYPCYRPIFCNGNSNYDGSRDLGLFRQGRILNSFEINRSRMP